MSDIKRVETEIVTCQDCIYADVDHIGCSRPDEVEECFDEDGTQYIYTTQETE